MKNWLVRIAFCFGAYLLYLPAFDGNYSSSLLEQILLFLIGLFVYCLGMEFIVLMFELLRALRIKWCTLRASLFSEMLNAKC